MFKRFTLLSDFVSCEFRDGWAPIFTHRALRSQRSEEKYMTSMKEVWILTTDRRPTSDRPTSHTDLALLIISNDYNSATGHWTTIQGPMHHKCLATHLVKFSIQKLTLIIFHNDAFKVWWEWDHKRSLYKCTAGCTGERNENLSIFDAVTTKSWWLTFLDQPISIGNILDHSVWHLPFAFRRYVYDTLMKRALENWQKTASLI